MKNTKESQLQKSTSPRLLLMITAAILFICLISSASFFYVRQLEDAIQDETDSNLIEIAEQLSIIVDNQVQGNLRNLESIALFLRAFDNIEEARITQFIETEAVRYSYEKIFLSNESGHTLFSDGSLGSIADMKFYSRAMDGESVITVVSSSNQNWIIYATPIYSQSGREIIGVSGAVQNLESLSNSLEVDFFGGEGYVQLVKADGTAIVESQHKYAIGPYDNYFDALEESGYQDGGQNSLNSLRKDMAEGRTGIIGLMRGSRECRMCYMPLTTNNWYLLTVVPISVINTKTDYFVQNTAIICVLITILFLVLILALIGLHNSSRKKLERMAYTDAVTNGLNWRSFEAQTGEILKKARESEYVMGHLNLQKFKLINDMYGREAGNKTLRYVYDTIQELLAPDELVSRVSADNFNLLLRFTSEEGIAKRVQEFYHYLNRFNEGRLQKYWLTFTQGFFIIDDPKLELSTMQERANIARQSRENGLGSRAGVAFYDDSSRASLLMEKNIENKMEMALKNRDFFVYLQPKYELANRTIAGAEALVRWRDPEQGMLLPDLFIPVFERNGFIVRLDLYVFEEVCRSIRRWLNEGKKVTPISVNLSRAHLPDPDFLEPYRKICDKYEVSPSLLEFELTESIMFENFKSLAPVIENMHQAGFTCSMDDFGSGYSSLNILKEMPVDAIKLDRDFFLPGSKTDITRGKSVIETVIELAKKLHIKTVAEGIETLEQVDYLKAAGCDMIQGFVFAKPMPIPEFEKLAYPIGGKQKEAAGDGYGACRPDMGETGAD
ncbi:bifunctional diguanylate cyclase/phosphodiesterase [Fumia xinanensis]|uniref:GGDEF domain-containing protein n=1 Tax=Fumia xinanensis TaxID=2763659 RepID=A0A926I6N8_9FIRM|nr:GGDEF domain-containing protein [Fumia xinanensis]MBC8559051.1 GGDEF domain-containing protein [Fumia xinanensis]